MDTNITKTIKTDENILKQMRQCNLLKLMNDEQFDRVVQTCKVLQLPANTIIFEQDSKLTHIYLVISGDIKLLRLVPNGDEKVMDVVQPGKTFAEGVLFAGNNKYPVTSMTISSSVIVGIQSQTYLDILQDSNELCLSMLGYLSVRLKWMVNEVQRLTLHNAQFRLVEYMLGEVNYDKNHRACLKLSIPKHVLASRLSIKPETLSRTFKELSNLGLIKYEGSNIELLDPDALRRYISLES